ncbi:hypothetical protein BDF14DRAFT_997925 [Spinellus fusiger]|nr:hypothetical protein BDF14DRAFT_997925 [Spinellus fusiger]
MLVHLLPLLCLFSLVSGSYKVQQSIPVYYNTLFTYNTHLPIAYASSPLVCPAEGQKTHAWLDVHKELRGDHLVKSPINVTTLQDTPCQVLCTRYWSVHDAATAISLIEADYQVEWRLDTLPGATVSYTNKISQRTYRIGFPLGQKLVGALINNQQQQQKQQQKIPVSYWMEWVENSKGNYT